MNMISSLILIPLALNALESPDALSAQALKNDPIIQQSHPESALPEDVKEIGSLLKTLAVSHCGSSGCAYGLMATTSIIPLSDPDRQIPATVTAVVHEKAGRPYESYLGLIVDFTDAAINATFRIIIIDRDLDGDVDMMTKQAVNVTAANEELIEEKACYSRINPDSCKASMVRGEHAIPLNTYSEAVGNLVKLLRTEQQRRGIIKT